MTQRSSIRWPERTLLVLGIVLTGLWLRHDSEARVLRSAESKKFEAARASSGSSGRLSVRPFKDPWCPPKLESGVFGRIEIPRLGISALIAEGAGPVQLDRWVGHIATTAYPGQAGNCALAGHRDSFLRGLGDARENDVIWVDTLQGSYMYVVEWGRVVGPSRIDVLDPTTAPSLTLVTCYPFFVVGPAPDRFVVRARLVEPTAAITD